MNKLIKYGAVGMIGYMIGQAAMKYRIMRNFVKATLKKDKENQEEVEAQ